MNMKKKNKADAEIQTKKSPELDITTEEDKRDLADQALCEYDFGDAEIVGQDSWDTSDPLDYCKVLYIASEDGGDSSRASFHVRFDVNGVSKCYAFDMMSGSEFGFSG